MNDRAAQASAEMIHRRSGLVVSWRRVREIVCRIQQRTVPQFVEIPVKSVRARFGDVVDLGSAVAALIDRIGESIHGHFRNRIQSQDEVGRKATIEVGERIVGFQSVNDVAVGEGGQSVELDVAVTVAAADKVVAAACRVDERPGRKLQRIGQVAARIWQVLERGRIKRASMCLRSQG